MSLTLEQYLALSVFDYDKIEPGYKDKAIGKFLDKINKDDNKKLIPELGVLSQIQNWVLIGYEKNTISGMGAVAFQNPDTKEIVIAYRGTHGIKRNIKEAIKDYETDLAIASSGNKVVEHGLNQFQDAFNFYIDIKNKTKLPILVR